MKRFLRSAPAFLAFVLTTTACENSKGKLSTTNADQSPTQNPTPLAYYFPACPPWLYPIAISVPDDTPKIEKPECAPGQPCLEAGSTCMYIEYQDPHYARASQKVTCLDQQPVSEVCPISSAVHKENIHYLSPDMRKQISDEVFQMKLASYQYRKGLPHAGEPQLGFIIEDDPDSIFVMKQGKQVNLYALTSGAIVAIQELKKQIKDQNATIEELRRELARIRSGSH